MCIRDSGRTRKDVRIDAVPFEDRDFSPAPCGDVRVVVQVVEVVGVFPYARGVEDRAAGSPETVVERVTPRPDEIAAADDHGIKLFVRGLQRVEQDGFDASAG